MWSSGLFDTQMMYKANDIAPEEHIIEPNMTNTTKSFDFV